jgi:hypothetical protein
MDESRVSESFVAFIDLLGFGDVARAAHTTEQLKTLHYSLDAIRQEFEFKPMNALTRGAQSAVEKSVLMFSDCVVVAVPLRSSFTQLTGVFDLLASELHAIALSQASCALKGHFVRGAIDVGLWYYKDDYLISPALARAYQLEGRADYPIVAVTDALHAFLADNPDRARYSSEIDPMNYLFKTCQTASGMMVRHLDYIGISLGAVAEEAHNKGEEELTRQVRSWLMEHATSIRKAHANAPKGRPKAKFLWLAEYHNSVVQSRVDGANDLLIRL